MDIFDAGIHEIIAAAGGTSELARKLGYDAEGGRQRVHNWIARGAIPADVLVHHRRMFAKLLRRYRRGNPL